MKILFYVLTLVAMGVGIYFANSNKDKFALQQKVRFETFERNGVLSDYIDITEEELRNEEEGLELAKNELAEVLASLEKLGADENSYRRDLRQLESAIKIQQKKLDDAEQARLEVEKALREIGIEGPVRLNTIKSRYDTMDDQRKELEVDISELDTNIEAGETAVANNHEEIGRLTKRRAERATRIRTNAVESVITQVDHDWGFVVIGAGSSSGFTPQTRLLVRRDGRIVGEVEPSSIEAAQTIAEIDYDTVAAGIRIQPGDRVILADPVSN